MAKLLGRITIERDDEGKLHMEGITDNELSIETFITMILKYLAGLIETEEVEVKMNK